MHDVIEIKIVSYLFCRLNSRLRSQIETVVMVTSSGERAFCLSALSLNCSQTFVDTEMFL